VKRALVVVVALAVAPVAAADTIAIDPAEAPAIAARLAGQRFTITGDRLTIDDIAHEGAPLIGVVEVRGDHAWLVRDDAAPVRLAGPLARPRIAGPGYTVWVIGAIAGDTVTVRRLGVLRRRR
jgi:hypothetical protein